MPRNEEVPDSCHEPAHPNGHHEDEETVAFGELSGSGFGTAELVLFRPEQKGHQQLRSSPD